MRNERPSAVALEPADRHADTDEGLFGEAGFWIKRSGGRYNREQARIAAVNICGFFSLLRRWAERGEAVGSKE